MPKKPAVVTGPHPGGGWQNKVEGNQRASNLARTKAEAEATGRVMAQRLHTEHKIQNKEGAASPETQQNASSLRGEAVSDPALSPSGALM